jgi:hypothetical protein
MIPSRLQPGSKKDERCSRHTRCSNPIDWLHLGHEEFGAFAPTCQGIEASDGCNEVATILISLALADSAHALHAIYGCAIQFG